METRPLNVLSIGAGAIGTYVGGSLALAGYRVTFLEKPETVASIRQISVQIEGSKHSVEKPVLVESIEEALLQERFDAALLAIKSFDTAAAMQSLAPFAAQMPPIICLQNGVENEDMIAAVLGPDKVIPATVTTAVGRRGPGEIAVERLRGIGISSQHSLSTRLFQAFYQAGLRPKLFDHPISMKWSKLLTNLVANATSAILAMTPDEIFSDPDLFEVEVRQLKEALAVMRALGVPVTNLPGTPVKALASAIRWIPLPILRPLLKKAVVDGRGDKMPSFYIDMQAGRKKSEVDYLNGAVARIGAQAGVDAPVNRFLTKTLSGMVSGTIPRDRYMHNPAEFLQDLAAKNG